MSDAGATQFPFLDADFSVMQLPQRPVNVFSVSGFPRWETVASRVLAYFLNPREDRHRMGTLAVDALIQSLAGARPLKVREGAASMGFDPIPLLGSDAWTVETEAVTTDGKRVDILLTNADHGIALVVENKIDAGVQNPFASYAAHASVDYETVLTIVLSPRRIFLTDLGLSGQWVSAAITYDDVFDHLVSAIRDRREGVDSRSLDILEQFIENTSEKERRMDAEAEARVLQSFWDATVGPDKKLAEFFEALTRVNKILMNRASRLAAMIEDALKERGLLQDSWIAAGNDRTWGRSDGRVAIVYVAFELTTGNCIELLVGQLPRQTWSGFAVKAYPNRRQPGKMYPDYRHVPMTVSWNDLDDDVVSDILRITDQLEIDHPGTRAL